MYMCMGKAPGAAYSWPLLLYSSILYKLQLVPCGTAFLSNIVLYVVFDIVVTNRWIQLCLR